MHLQVVALSVHIDKLAQSRVRGYPENLISDAMKNTEKAKGRLLCVWRPFLVSVDEFSTH